MVRFSRNKTVLLFIFALILISSGSCTTGTATVTVPATTQTEITTPPASSGTVHEIVIDETSFVPEKIKVRTGDTVVWLNSTQEIHSITSIYHFQDEDDVSHIFFGETWVSGDIAPGETFSYTFRSAGSFEYARLPFTLRQPTDQYRDFVKVGVGFITVE